MKNRLLLSLVIMALLAGCGGDRTAKIVFDNQSNCGTIPITLTNATNADDVKHIDAAQGQRTEVVVTPDVFYEYMVDFSGAGKTADGFRCTALKQGKLSVPAGTSQTFRLEVENPTATP
jgi:hypothetical protein